MDEETVVKRCVDVILTVLILIVLYFYRASRATVHDVVREDVVRDRQHVAPFLNQIILLNRNMYFPRPTLQVLYQYCVRLRSLKKTILIFHGQQSLNAAGGHARSFFL